MAGLLLRIRQTYRPSANDKFVVRDADSEDNIWWGVYNRPFAADKFEVLYDRMLGFLQGRDVFVQDVYAGADENYRLPVRIVTELAWHSMFVRNMFILPQSLEEYKRFVPEFTIIAMPSISRARPRWITPTRNIHLSVVREEACHHWQYGLCGRDQEIRVHDFELSAAAGRRAFDALFRECESG